MFKRKRKIGSFAHVSLPELGIHNELAKVDTGAYSGAVHCYGITVIRRANGKRSLKFALSADGSHVVRVDKYIATNARSSTGHRTRRYLIDTEVIIDGKTYPIRIGLSDRSDMKFDVLLGRRFLRANNFIVDTSINAHLDSDGRRVEK